MESLLGVSPKKCKHGRVATAVMRKIGPRERGRAGDFVIEAEDYTCHHPAMEIVRKFGSNGCAGCPEFGPRDA